MVGGVLCWYSEQWAEQRLQEYVGRLEDLDFKTEEQSLADFHVNAVAEIHYFSDFHSYAEQKDVNKVYYDRGIHALYFLHPSIEDGTVAEIFYYK
jgi:hypothetical protein